MSAWGSKGWGLRPGEPAGSVSDYWHDGVSESELFELLGYEPSAVLVRDIFTAVGLPELDTHCERAFDKGGDAEPLTFASGGLPIDLVALNELDIEAEVGASPDEPSWSDLVFDVPDFTFDEPYHAADLLPEVTLDTRARQQAIEFLHRIGELSNRHVAWLAEIILARRWSAAQRHVVELLQSGFTLRSIYLSFLLSEHWRESDVYDERFDLGAHRPAWQTDCLPRISWWEAVQLVVFHGEDCTLEEIVEFVDQERELWRRSRALTRQFPRFKDYLLRQRLAEECRVSSGGWYRTLDPRDGRRFDGSANPEYTAQWWDDELPAMGGASYVQSRIYVGDELSWLIVEPDDGLHWLED